MRILIALLATVSCCIAEAPYPPSGTKPQGALLVLPKEYGPPPQPRDQSTLTDNTRGDNYENVEDFNSKIMERFRQEQGSERGVYHVYLEDGRLQRVQYTTAPISTQQSQQQYQAPPEILSPESASKRGVYFVQVPQQRIRQLQAARDQQQQYKQPSQKFSSPLYSSQYSQQQQQQQQEGTPGYVANVQYSQVEPIQGPVYSYSPQALTRVLRYAPVFY